MMMLMILLIIILINLLMVFNVDATTNVTTSTTTDINQLIYQFNYNQLKEMIKTEVQLELSKSNNVTEKSYTIWSNWSKCKNCVQKRTKYCTNCMSKIYEERPCDNKRCDRKLRMKTIDNKMHVINIDEMYETRSLKQTLWSKWSKWADCSPQCITYRYRICKIPAQCIESKQKQHAYCYHERTKCESFVLNLYDSRKGQDYGIYEYENHTKKRKTKFPHTNRCGRPFRRSKMLKIIGGKVSSKYKWPWHVAVLNKYMNVFCAGTLIHPKWVLTAGHCIRAYLIVRLNEHDLTAIDGREIELHVEKSILHPRFNHKTVDNDIALLKLPRSVQLPVACMPNKKPSSYTKCTIMGWGKKKFSDRDGSALLREANVQITNQQTCSKSYKNYILTSNMFCAGLPNGAADTCAGDSGGGLMCPFKKGKSFAYTVEGITSFGEGCGRANKYGIYTMVYNYLKWIKHTIEYYS